MPLHLKRSKGSSAVDKATDNRKAVKPMETPLKSSTALPSDVELASVVATHSASQLRLRGQILLHGPLAKRLFAVKTTLVPPTHSKTQQHLGLAPRRTTQTQFWLSQCALSRKQNVAIYLQTPLNSMEMLLGNPSLSA